MISIGHWEFNRDTGELSGNGEHTRLPEQQLLALSLLVDAGQNALVPREKFISVLWPDGRVVEYDQSLNTCIRKLRKALLDNAENPLFIETIPGKGYRLLVAPEQVEHSPAKNAHSTSHWQLLVAGLITVVLVSFYIFKNFMAPGGINQAPQRLIILPFEANTQKNHSLINHANAIREVLLNEIAVIPTSDLAIISGESVFNWRDHGQLHRDSDLLLSGMIQEDPLNIQMLFRINSRDGQLLWSDSINWLKGAGLKQQVPVVERLIQGITETTKLPNEIAGKITAGRNRISSGLNSGKFNEAVFLAGQKNAEANEKAIAILQQLAEEEPDNSQVIEWLATLYQRIGGANIAKRQQSFKEAQFWVNRGLLIAPQSAELYRVRAYIQLYGDWQPKAALQSIEKAVSLAPNNAEIRSVYAAITMVLGQPEASLKQARLAQTLDPLAMLINADLCWYLNFAKQFETAVNECQNTLNLQKNAVWIRLGLIEAQLKTHNRQAALDAFQHISGQSPVHSQNPEQGFHQAYLTWIQQLESGYASGRIDPYMIAALYAQLELKAEAIQWLKQAKKDNSGFFIFAPVDSRLQSIGNEADFKSVIAHDG